MTWGSGYEGVRWKYLRLKINFLKHNDPDQETMGTRIQKISTSLDFRLECTWCEENLLKKPCGN